MISNPSIVSLMREALRLLRPMWPLALFATAMGALSGIATAALLAAVNQALHAEGGPTTGLLLAFAGLCLIAVGGEVASSIGNSVVGQRVVATLRQDLVARVLCAPLAQLERFRIHRLIATLNQDVDMISAFSFQISALAIAAAVTLGSFCYLLVLSPAMFLLALGAVAAAAIGLVCARRAGIRNFEIAREAEDELQAGYRAITEGAKELRLNRQRRARVFGVQLKGAIAKIRHYNVRAMTLFFSANAIGSVLFFAVVGVVLALAAGGATDQAVLSGFVIVLLYVRGPIEQLVLALPMIGQAQVAFRRVAALSAEFTNREPHLGLAGGAAGRRDFATIELDAVRFAFPRAPGGEVFALGPLSLSIRRGELLFVTGVNGSGKTTLIKLLLGLYEPSAGAIRVDGRAVDARSRDDYRQLFSVVFFDYFLFNDIVPPQAGCSAAVDALLARLQIAHKVAVNDGVFTTTDLSAGQRKRLALILALMEERPILVLDEWAAEQDPAYRHTFYRELLPALQRQGRTLIVSRTTTAISTSPTAS
jgi:putative pyoverdin transport system ATP-binding/permease protein